MNFREIVDQWRKIFTVAAKPERDDFMTTLKLSLLGMAIVGGIAFVIRVVFYAFLFPQMAG
ncbi:MAG: protein translocase SEC61 complex subunit gamma [Thermogladius sp.]|uniref:Protein translocase SEC61 complex subunit gamma n=1 Tax=Thermogladius calderae TaxID=1200300 RepID=A0A7J3XXD2_9CREN|nr:protein translocase SEC61 complex subunit gamma [Thermogladius sp.]